jgi:hypothetical protein
MKKILLNIIVIFVVSCISLKAKNIKQIELSEADSYMETLYKDISYIYSSLLTVKYANPAYYDFIGALYYQTSSGYYAMSTCDDYTEGLATFVYDRKRFKEIEGVCLKK